MILTEAGLHFRQAPDGTEWQCVEVPAIRMTRDGSYIVETVVYTRLEEAVRASRDLPHLTLKVG